MLQRNLTVKTLDNRKTIFTFIVKTSAFNISNKIVNIIKKNKIAEADNGTFNILKMCA